jgi:hypothetical protein
MRAGARSSTAPAGHSRDTAMPGRPILEEEVGLSRGAIFSYYPSKLDLFTALAAVDRNRVGTLWLEQGFDAVAQQGAGFPIDVESTLELVRSAIGDPDR